MYIVLVLNVNECKVRVNEGLINKSEVEVMVNKEVFHKSEIEDMVNRAIVVGIEGGKGYIKGW